MPFTLRIDNDAVAYQKLSGRIVVEDLVELVRATMAHPGFKHGIALVTDLRDSDVSAVNSSDLRGLVEYMEQSGAAEVGFRLAIIAPQDLAFGMSRIFEVLSERLGIEQMVFRTPAEAFAWLGLLEGDTTWDAIR